MDKYETLMSIMTEEDLGKIKKPKICFYSSRKIVQSLLALEEVRDVVEDLVESGKGIKIRRTKWGFHYTKLSKKGKPVSDSLYVSRPRAKGLRMLKMGLDMMREKKYFWGRRNLSKKLQEEFNR